MFSPLGLIHKIVGAISLGLILGLFMAYKVEQRSADKWEATARKHAAELKRISSARNEQQIVTRDRIVYVKRAERDAGKVAERIERAPVTPGKCATPREILGADL